MLTNQAKQLSSYFISKAIIPGCDRDKYDYCFEILLSTFLNLFILVALGILLHRIVETLVFIVCFMAMRGSSGGFHAKTHTKCILLLLSTYVVFIILANYLPPEMKQWGGETMITISLFLFYLIPPNPDANNPADPEKMRHLKIKSKFFISVLFIIFNGLLFIESSARLAFPVAFSSFMVAVSVMTGTIKNIEGGAKNEEDT